MTEIYWITRLDYIQGCLFTFLLIVGIVITVAAVSAFIFNEKEAVTARKTFKWAIPSFVIAMLVSCFIPSTKEAMLIYGLGGTIDYIKSNDKAKELPDKVIDALTRYIDGIENSSNDKASSKKS